LIAYQLLPQKEVLGREGRTRAQAREQEAHGINKEYQQRAYELDETAEEVHTSSHSQGLPLKRRLWSILIVAVGSRDLQRHEDAMFAERSSPS